MNAKKCKKLRKIAQLRTVGLPKRDYKTWHVGGALPDGHKLPDQVILDPNSTQGTYKDLKSYVKLYGG